METIEEIARRALAEDLPDGRDITSELFVPAGVSAEGSVVSRHAAVVSGLSAAIAVFHAVSEDIVCDALIGEGEHVAADVDVMAVAGPAGAVLTAERTVLNLLGHLSGIATLTSQFVARCKPYGTAILGTRKMTPGLRQLEVSAIRHGGGDIYRSDLSTSVLLKDNHKAIQGGIAGIANRVNELRRIDSQAAERLLASGKIEVDTLDELHEVVRMGWKQILIDNFTPADVKQAVRNFGDQVTLEVSGGVTLENVEAYAASGVPYISVGALTHSARSADFSLEMEWRRK